MILPPEESNEFETPGLYLSQLGNDGFYQELHQSQQADPKIINLASRWLSLTDEKNLTTKESTFLEGHKVTPTRFYKRIGERWLLMIPDESQQRVLYEYHDVDLAGHPGAEETVRAIQEHFFGME